MSFPIATAMSPWVSTSAMIAAYRVRIRNLLISRSSCTVRTSLPGAGGAAAGRQPEAAADDVHARLDVGQERRDAGLGAEHAGEQEREQEQGHGVRREVADRDDDPAGDRERHELGAPRD